MSRFYSVFPQPSVNQELILSLAYETSFRLSFVCYWSPWIVKYNWPACRTDFQSLVEKHKGPFGLYNGLMELRMQLKYELYGDTNVQQRSCYHRCSGSKIGEGAQVCHDRGKSFCKGRGGTFYTERKKITLGFRQKNIPGQKISGWKKSRINSFW